MKFRSTIWLQDLRLQISAINHYWDAWVVGYTPNVQMSLLTRYLGDVDRKTIGMILLSVFFGLLAVTAVFLMLRRSHQKVTPVEREYLRYCRILEKEGLPRQFGEGAINFAERVAAERPELAAAVRAVTNAYVRVNFEKDDPDNTELIRKAIKNIKRYSFTQTA